MNTDLNLHGAPTRRALRIRFLLGLACSALLLSALPGRAQEDEDPVGDRVGVGAPLHVEGRTFLHRDGPRYENLAFSDYEIPESSLIPPFERRNYYGPLGTHLIDGYNVFSWRELRAETGTEVGARSSMGKWGRYNLFQRNVVAHESYGGWAARFIIGDEIRTFFTPLTFSQAGVNGLRLDVDTGGSRFSAIASRYRHPLWTGGQNRPRVRDSSLLLGGHAETDVGAMTLGATGVHFHLFDSEQEAFHLRGDLTSAQGLPSTIIVRFADDSPTDERGGPVISQVRLLVNGVPRPDIVPVVARLDSRNPTFVGVNNRLTGQFLRTPYPDQDTRYADVLYLLKHNAGEDISRNVNLPELLREVTLVPAGGRQQADGYEVVEYFFDLSQEPYVRQIEVETLVGNDYRVEVFGLHEDSPEAVREEARWQVGSMEDHERAEGNVQDLSNMDWVRLQAGVWTGRSVVSTNGTWEALGGRVRWEYARSIEYRRYPDGRPGHRDDRELAGVRDWLGERSIGSDAAYYVTAEWERPRYSLGGEAFSIGTDFTRQLIGTDAGNLLIGEEITDGFIEDNDDNDRWPDRGPGVRFGHLGAAEDDPDGIFPGNDEDNDGIPDTNRNGNDLPDYEEAFLLFDVESSDYVYDRDWNHNGMPDVREDDLEPDLPYQIDQRGVHIFGTLHLPGGVSLTLGRLDAEGIASGGRNESTYGGVELRHEWPGAGHLRYESFVQRVRDDIANPYQIYRETLTLPDAQGSFHAAGARVYEFQVVNDLLDWRNSVDHQHYVEGGWQPLPELQLWANGRLGINRQLAGSLGDGTDQRSDELRLVSSVAKAEYEWQVSDLWLLTFQAKGLYLRQQRDSLPIDLRHEWTAVPIVKARCQLTPRTRLSVGTQGLPGLPLRRRDHDDGRDSMKETVRIVELSNRSTYYGYEISTSLGLRATHRSFDHSSRDDDEIDVTSIFMRVFLGYE